MHEPLAETSAKLKSTPLNVRCWTHVAYAAFFPLPKEGSCGSFSKIDLVAEATFPVETPCKGLLAARMNRPKQLGLAWWICFPGHGLGALDLPLKCLHPARLYAPWLRTGE